MSASFGNALDIQPDGRIVVAGVSQNATGDHFAVARLKLGGGLDESFSGDGRRTFGFGGINDDGYAVAIQSDGRAIVSGYSEQNRQGDDFAVARLRGD